MAFRLRRGRSIGHEVTALYDAQLAAAIAKLTADATCDMHAVRKHIKKARALLHVAVTAGATAARHADRALKIANRSLGVVADAHRILKVLPRLSGFDRVRPPDDAIERVRRRLQARAATFDAIADRDGTRARAARLLISARAGAGEWNSTRLDAGALTESVRIAHHQARAARRAARDRPRVEAFHRWRRRVKLEFYLYRLISDHTGDRMRYDRRRLAAVDACLGKLHDLSVLGGVLAAEPILSRHETATMLLVIRAASRDLRRRAEMLSLVLNDHPGEVRGRIEALWGTDAVLPMEDAWPAIASA